MNGELVHIVAGCMHCCGEPNCGRPGTVSLGQYSGDCCRRLRAGEKCSRRRSCYYDYLFWLRDAGEQQ